MNHDDRVLEVLAAIRMERVGSLRWLRLVYLLDDLRFGFDALARGGATA